MQKFITSKSVTRLIRKVKGVVYHTDPNCESLTRRGGQAEAICETDCIAYAEYLKPCLSCCPADVKLETPKKPEARELPHQVYPYKHQIIIWTCSDGREFSEEKDALWYELEITKKRLVR